MSFLDDDDTPFFRNEFTGVPLSFVVQGRRKRPVRQWERTGQPWRIPSRSTVTLYTDRPRVEIFVCVSYPRTPTLCVWIDYLVCTFYIDRFDSGRWHEKVVPTYWVISIHSLDPVVTNILCSYKVHGDSFSLWLISLSYDSEVLNNSM